MASICLGLNELMRIKHFISKVNDVSYTYFQIFIYTSGIQLTGYMEPLMGDLVIDIYALQNTHDDVIKWKNFPCNWPFVRAIPRSPVNSPHKGQPLGDLMFSFICAWTNGSANHRDTSDLRRHRAHYHVTVMTNIWLPSNLVITCNPLWQNPNIDQIELRGPLLYLVIDPSHKW